MKTLVCTIVLLLSFNLKANYGEHFGVSGTSLSLGGQSSGDIHDPANNFYAPALNAFTDSVSLSVSVGLMQTDFKEINNVQIENGLTKDGANETGSISTEYDNVSIFIGHALIPLFKSQKMKLGLSLLTPIENFVESNTGNTFRTEYVMYRARQNRTIIYANLIYPFNDSFSLSLGGMSGFQASSTMDTQQSLNGSTPGSSANMKTEIKRTIAALFSMAYQSSWAKIFFSYQQEMKTNLKVDVSGRTASPSVPFDTTIETMLYYDPHILRLGLSKDISIVKILTTLEYQLWENYKSPIIEIKQNSGNIQGSKNLETIKTKNIFIPKVGTTLDLHDHFKLNFGLSYRPTPIDSDFSGVGNSVDSNIWSYSLGIDSPFEYQGMSMGLYAGAQYQKLEDLKVTKSANREDGNSSENKIGSPGYDIGGDITSLIVEARVKF